MEQFERFLLSKPAWAIGLLQSLGVVAYVSIFVLSVFLLDPTIRIDSPILAAITVLTSFVTSALICGSLVLGAPAMLALKGHIKQAVMILVWSATWFVVLLLSWVVILAAID